MQKLRPVGTHHSDCDHSTMLGILGSSTPLDDPAGPTQANRLLRLPLVVLQLVVRQRRRVHRAARPLLVLPRVVLPMVLGLLLRQRLYRR